MEKGNIVSIHRKSEKQNINDYGPVSLIPTCGETFERLIFNEMFNFFSANMLIFNN